MKWWIGLIGSLVWVSMLQVVIAGDQAVAVQLGQRELFLDDHVIAEINQLHRTMHQPNKQGAVIRADPGDHVVIAQGAPFWDPRDKMFKFWVDGYRQSPDGLNWTKVSGQEGVKLNGVLYDAMDPDGSRRYKSWTPSAFHVSPDALSWTKLDVPPVPSSDTWSISFDEEDRLYIATVKHGGVYGRSVFLSTSRDFEHWSEPTLIFEADEFDQELARRRIERRFADPTLQNPEYNIPEHYGMDVYRLGVFRYEGLYVGLPMMFHHTGTVTKQWAGFDRMNLSDYILGLVRKYGDYTGFHHVQLACSRDLHHWQRLGDRQPFIDTSHAGSGAYDTQSVSSPYDVLRRGDELWFYYTGLKYRGGMVQKGGKWVPGPGFKPDRDSGAICLAVLRRDGFVSLEAGMYLAIGGPDTGMMLSKPFVVPGEKLLVNVDAPDGHLLVEAMSHDGKILARSSKITGDQLRGEVTWEEGAFTDLKGQAVSLRFTLRNGHFYSYWVE